MGVNQDETISKLLLHLYETTRSPEEWNPFLSTLQSCTDSQSAGLIVHDISSLTTMGIETGLDPVEVDKFYRHYSKVNPWMPTSSQDIAQGKEILRTELFQPLHEHRKTEFHNDWGRRNDVVFSIAVNLRISTRQFYYLCLNRGERRGPHSDEAESLLRLLTPHLRNALRVRAAEREFADREKQHDPSLPAGTAFLLGRDGVVQAMSDRGRTVVETKDGLQLGRNRQLVAIANQKAIADALNAIHLDPFGQPRFVRIPRTPPKRDFLLLIRALKGPTLWSATLLDPHIDLESTIASIGRAYGLTPAECRVVVALLTAGGLDRALESLTVSRNTVKKQLDAVFRKTGTNRQAEVVRLFSALGAMAHLGEDF